MSDDLYRAGLTIVGTVVGFFTPLGPALGAFLGGLAGSLIWPIENKQQGPRLNELNVQRSTVGAPIPIVYGTVGLAGNIIWSGGLTETRHSGSSGGKKGPDGPTSFSYSVDVAVGICEGPITGIRRIWADADLIYDASSDEDLQERLENRFGDALFGGNPEAWFRAEDIIASRRASNGLVNFVLYLGTEDQLPDPTIQSYENVNYGYNVVPAYRGLAYIVFPAFQLEKYGNRIPNFKFEVFSGTAVEDNCSSYSVGHLERWQYQLDGGVFDPRNPDNAHTYKNCMADIGGFGSAVFSYDSVMAELAGATGEFGNSVTWIFGETPQVGDSVYCRGWSVSSTPNWSQPYDVTSAPSLDVDRVMLTININCLREFPNSFGDVAPTCVRDTLWWVSAGDGSGFAYRNLNNTGIPAPYPGGNWDNRGDCTEIGTGVTLQQWASFDQEICCQRYHGPRSCESGTPIPSAPGFCIIDGVVTQSQTWTRVAGTFKALRHYRSGAGDLTNVVLDYPIDPTLRNDDPDYNNQAFWEAAYAVAVANNASLDLDDPNRIPENWVYGVDYPEERFSHATNFQSGMVWQSFCEPTVAPNCVPMAAIVTDICRRAGLRTDTFSQIDVSGLTTCVEGYVVGHQMSGRDALMPLRMFGLWDAVESDGLLRFVERGHAIVQTLTADDLGAHENGSEPPSLVEVTRTQEKELPRRLRLHFPNAKQDLEVAEQFASRITTEALDEIDVELAVSMEPDSAKQLAEIMLYEAWVSRNRYKLSLDNDWLALEPTDCIEIPVDGSTERVRILSVDYSIGGILKIEAVRDDDGAYVSTAVADDGAPSGGLPGSTGGGPICPSGVVLLDIPRLRDEDTDAGYYAAIYGLCLDFWNCAELYRSNDGGVTYGRVARTDFEITVGEIVSISGPDTDPVLPGDSPAYDAGNSITVNLFEGTLSSVTDDQIAVGQNLAAVGVDGRWVLIQFKTATLDTGNQWTLSDIIWGVNDTTHLLGTTVDGDTFVLLSDPDLIRIPETPDNIGVEKQFKIISCGESIDAVTEFNFTTWGLSYLRLCPSTVLSATLTEPPGSPTNGDSYLLPNDTSLAGVWATHDGEIATWSDETDSWVFCTPAPGTIIHIVGEDSDDPGDDVISPGGGGTPTPAPWAPINATYLTEIDESTRLPNSRRLVAGDGISFELTEDSSGNQLIIHGADTDGGGGYPEGTYLTRIDERADLPFSLRLLEGSNIVFAETTDGELEISANPGAGIAINTQTGNYTLVFSDAGKCIDRATGSAATWTIPSQASVAFALGTVAMLSNRDADTNVTIAITSGVLQYIPGGAVGSRTLLPYGIAYLQLIDTATNTWRISGAGLV